MNASYGNVSGTYTAPSNGILYSWFYAGNANNSRYCNISINGGSNVPNTGIYSGNDNICSTAVFLYKDDTVDYNVTSSGLSGGGVWFVSLE